MRKEAVELQGYEGFSLVGSGGNAHVYSAVSVETGENVAIKVMRGTGDEAVNRRFERERSLMTELETIANVVPVHESGVTEGGDPFLVMPLYVGGSLQNLLERGPIPWRDAVELTRKVSAAIALAHAKRILHLDVKPANVLLDERGEPWLADFGIAEMMGSTASMSAQMMTPAFTPPERLSGAKPSEQTDIYGIGSLLFSLLAGEAPFVDAERTSPAAVVLAVMNEPVPVDRLPDDTPESLVELVRRAMSKDIADRPTSAIAFVGLLDDVLGGGPVGAPITPADALFDPMIETGPAVVAAAPVAAQDDDDDRKPVVWFASAAMFLLLGGLGTLAAVVFGGDGDNVSALNVEESVGLEETSISEPSEAQSTGGTALPAADQAEADAGNGDDGDSLADVEVAGQQLTAEDGAVAVGSVVEATTSTTGTSTTTASTTTEESTTTTAGPTTTAAPTSTTVTTTTAKPTTTTAKPTTTTTTTTTTAPVDPPAFAERIDIGDISETALRFRFSSSVTTGYTVLVRSGVTIVKSQSGTASANTLVNATVTGLTAGTDYTVQVRLTGPPIVSSLPVAFRTPGGEPEPTETPVSLLDLRVVDLQATRFEVNYESNVCANGSFTIRKQGGGIVGSNAGQADGCTTRHLGIPGFWTPALEPDTTYVITVRVEADGQGKGDGNTATKSLTVTTAS